MNLHRNTAAGPRPWFGLMVGLTAVGGAFAWLVLAADTDVARFQAAAAGEPAPAAIDGHAMGGPWSVKLRALPRGHTRDALRLDVAATLERLERELWSYHPASSLARFNAHRGTDWFEVSEDLARVVAAARVVSEHSGGAFDVTAGALANLWGFGPTAAGMTRHAPDDAQVAAARAHVNYRRLHARLAPPALKKDDPDIVVHLAAVARGYAAGRVAMALEAKGVTDYLVDVAGHVHARGRSPQGHPWRAAVDDGRPVELRDGGALSTVCDRRAFLEINGRRYSRDLDPRTGRPINHDLASVSVLHADPTYAAGMAAALMVLGGEPARELATRLKLGVLTVERGKERFEARATPAFERALASREDLATRAPELANEKQAGATRREQ
jgi:thiamine biosynthesis lipoprotein